MPTQPALDKSSAVRAAVILGSIRNSVDFRNSVQLDNVDAMIDTLKDAIPHEQRGPEYEWLIARRNHLARHFQPAA